MHEIISRLEARFTSSAQALERRFRDERASVILCKDSLIPLHAPLTDQGPVLFVDGGEGLLLETAGLLAARIRIAGVLFEGIKRTGVRIAQYRVIFEAGSEPGEGLSIQGDALPQGIEQACINEAKGLLSAAGLGALPGLLRSMLESHHAAQWASESSAILVVKDGPLARLGSYASSVERMLAKQKVPLLGLLKTSSLRCDDGVSVVAAFRSLASSPASLALGSAGPDGASRHVALLHAAAKSAFIIECASGGDDPVALVSRLLPLAADVSWLGYPYPLVLADQLARVSNEEVAAERVRILVSLSADGGAGVEAEMASKESHDILDRMRY